MNIYKPYNPFHPFDMEPVEFFGDPESKEWADDYLEMIRLN